MLRFSSATGARRIAPVGAALVAGVLMVTLAGCAGETASAPDGVVIALTEEPPTLDPCDTPTFSVGRVVAGNITESLVDRDPATGELVPVLATEWQQTDDTHWQFDIREGVTFSDGTPLTADIAAAAINRATDAALECFVTTFILGDMAITAEAADDATLVVTTERPDPVLPLRMSFVDIGGPDTPADKKSREPIGTGPYTLVKWTAGTDITLERNSTYWGDAPAVASARYIWRDQSAVRAAMISTGEADLAVDITSQDSGNLGSGAAETFALAETSFFRMDTFAEPLNDIRVREAINLAFDRDGFINSINGGLGEPASQIILSNVIGYNPDVEVWPLDVDKATGLVAEAKADGVDTDREITIIGRNGLYPNSTEACELMQATLASIGLTAKIEMLEASAWLEQLQKPFDPNRVVIQQSIHGNNSGDAAFTVYSKFHSQGGESTLEDPKVDQLIDTAMAATGDERQSTFQELFAYLSEQVIPVVPVAHSESIVGVSDRIGYEPNATTYDEIHLAEISLP